MNKLDLLLVALTVALVVVVGYRIYSWIMEESAGDGCLMDRFILMCAEQNITLDKCCWDSYAVSVKECEKK